MNPIWFTWSIWTLEIVYELLSHRGYALIVMLGLFFVQLLVDAFRDDLKEMSSLDRQQFNYGYLLILSFFWFIGVLIPWSTIRVIFFLGYLWMAKDGLFYTPGQRLWLLSLAEITPIYKKKRF